MDLNSNYRVFISELPFLNPPTGADQPQRLRLRFTVHQVAMTTSGLKMVMVI